MIDSLWSLLGREYQWSLGWLCNSRYKTHNDLYQVYKYSENLKCYILRGYRLGNMVVQVFTKLFFLVMVDPEPI